MRQIWDFLDQFSVHLDSASKNWPKTDFKKQDADYLIDLLCSSIKGFRSKLALLEHNIKTNLASFPSCYLNTEHNEYGFPTWYWGWYNVRLTRQSCQIWAHIIQNRTNCGLIKISLSHVQKTDLKKLRIFPFGANLIDFSPNLTSLHSDL